MSYIRKQYENQKIEKEAKKTGHKYCSPFYWDKNRERYMKYSSNKRRANTKKYFKRFSNKKVRKTRNLGNYNEYRMPFDYEWTID